MKCYSVQQNKLVKEIRPIPVTNAGEVLIKINAIGVNRVDLLQIEGKYPALDYSDIPGIEFSGIVVDTGERVCGLTSGGAYSEYIVVARSQLMKIPDSLSNIEAAALPEALAVAWHNLYTLGQIKDAKSILIHGGASGIGNILVQIAINHGLTVYTTASDLKKLAFFKDKCQILSFTDNFEKMVNQDCKVDLLIDILGGDYLNRNIKCCAFGAKIIMLAVMDGKSSTIDLGSLLMKNITLIGSTMRSKTTAEKALILLNVVDHLMPLIANGEVKPIISKTFAFDDVFSAHDHLKSRNNVGKVVITL